MLFEALPNAGFVPGLQTLRLQVGLPQDGFEPLTNQAVIVND
jgi:hypothetical protein